MRITLLDSLPFAPLEKMILNQIKVQILGSYNLRFNIPPNLPRALRKGAVSS